LSCASGRAIRGFHRPLLNRLDHDLFECLGEVEELVDDLGDGIALDDRLTGVFEVPEDLGK
jgi:hypothetical protein